MLSWLARPPIVVPLVASAVVLRFAFLGTDSLWLDEAFSVTEASRRSVAELWAGGIDWAHPTLFYVLLHWIIAVFGSSEAFVRLPSALASACNIGLTALVARRLQLGGGVAALAALLLAFAPLDIWYAQEARMYELVTLVGLLLVLGLTVDSWLGALIVTISLSVGFYLDFTMIPLATSLVGLWIVRWWYRGQSPLELARVAVSIAVSLWLARQLWPKLIALLDRIEVLTFFGEVRRLLQIDRFGVAASGIALLLIAAVTIAGSAWVRRRSVDNRFIQQVAWPIAIVFVVASVLTALPRAYSMKQILVTGWPYVVLAVASFARFNAYRVGLIILVSVASALATLATPRADWRGAVAHLNAHVSAGELVWLDPSYDSFAYNYYRPVVPPASGNDDEALRLRATASAGVWLVADRYGKRPPTSPSEAWLDREMDLSERVSLARLELRYYRPRRH